MSVASIPRVLLSRYTFSHDIGLWVSSVSSTARRKKKKNTHVEYISKKHTTNKYNYLYPTCSIFLNYFPVGVDKNCVYLWSIEFFIIFTCHLQQFERLDRSYFGCREFYPQLTLTLPRLEKLTFDSRSTSAAVIDNRYGKAITINERNRERNIDGPFSTMESRNWSAESKLYPRCGYRRFARGNIHIKSCKKRFERILLA